MIRIQKEAIFDTINELLKIDSPSGYSHPIMEKIKKEVEVLDYEFSLTNKGCGIITIPGKSTEKVIGVSAHVDTLGAMVRSITGNGNLRFTLIGGASAPTLDGEYCRIRTRDGHEYLGTFLSTSPSGHVFDDSSTKVRDEKNMEIRIDEKVTSKKEVEALGIRNGDYIFIEPKTMITESGFIKSRFIDDKAGVGCILTLLKYFREEAISPLYTTKVFFSVYEEVGHGSSYIPEDIEELLAIDMGCIGEDLNCTEYQVSICAKDSGGPYDYDMVSKLVRLGEQHKLNFAVDIYPHYGSDVVAALRAGQNIRGALIGTGVHASHGMERTHLEGLENTTKLLYLYLTNQ